MEELSASKESVEDQTADRTFHSTFDHLKMLEECELSKIHTPEASDLVPSPQKAPREHRSSKMEFRRQTFGVEVNTAFSDAQTESDPYANTSGMGSP